MCACVRACVRACVCVCVCVRLEAVLVKAGFVGEDVRRAFVEMDTDKRDTHTHTQNT